MSAPHQATITDFPSHTARCIAIGGAITPIVVRALLSTGLALVAGGCTSEDDAPLLLPNQALLPTASAAPSGSGGGGSTTPSAGVSPDGVPAGTSGVNQSTTLPDATTVVGTGIAGEAVTSQSATTTLPGGVRVTVRHGFYPGTTAPPLTSSSG